VMTFSARLGVVDRTEASSLSFALFEQGSVGIMFTLINELIAETILRMRSVRPERASCSNSKEHKHDDSCRKSQE